MWKGRADYAASRIDDRNTKAWYAEPFLLDASGGLVTIIFCEDKNTVTWALREN